MNIAPENRKKAAAVALIMLTIGLTGLAYALSNIWSIQEQGQVLSTGIEVYWDVNLTMPCTNITWPQMHPGESHTVNLWLYNRGSTNVTVLMTTSDWSPPETQAHITVSMTPSNPTLEAGKILQISRTTKIETSFQTLNVTNYNFVTHFTGEEY